MNSEKVLIERLNEFPSYVRQLSRRTGTLMGVLLVVLFVGPIYLDARFPRLSGEGFGFTMQQGFAFAVILLVSSVTLWQVRNVAEFTRKIDQELAALPTAGVVLIAKRLTGRPRRFAMNEIYLRARHFDDRLARAYFLRQPTLSYIGMHSRGRIEKERSWGIAKTALAIVGILTAMLFVFGSCLGWQYWRVANELPTTMAIGPIEMLLRATGVTWLVTVIILTLLVGFRSKRDYVTCRGMSCDDCLLMLLKVLPHQRKELLKQMEILRRTETEIDEAATHLGLP